MMAEVLTTGQAKFPDGKLLDVSGKDWLEFVKWVYTHVDGPPKQELELSGTATLAIVERIVDAPTRDGATAQGAE